MVSVSDWPAPELDPIERLHVLARVLPGVAIEERVIDAPFDEVWAFVSDLEGSVHKFDADVRKVRVVRREGERLALWGFGSWRFLGLPNYFRVELRDGFCWMASQGYVVGMAAVPEGDRTRFVHLEGLNVHGPKALRYVARPLAWISRLRHRIHVPHDVDGIERCLGLRR